MSEGNNDKLKDIFKQAAEVAAIVPENMQAEAFNRALEYLRGDIQINRQGKQSKMPSAPPPVNGGGESNSDWHHQVDRTLYPEVSSSKTVLELSLLVLRIARDEHGVDGLSPADIANVLKEKFRLNVSAGQVSDKLGKESALVNRHKDGKAYVYTLMQPGEAFLDSGTKRTRTTSKKKSKANKKPAVAKTGKPAKRSGSRVGPKGMVDKLIADGFFAKPKVTGDIIQHASHKLGYTYKATELSPALIRSVRSGALTREQNGDGQFEYTAG